MISYFLDLITSKDVMNLRDIALNNRYLSKPKLFAISVLL